MCEMVAQVSAEIPLASCAGITHKTHMQTVSDIIDGVGGTRKVANLLNLPSSTVQSWKKKNRIPAERVLSFERALGVSRSILRPDLYPDEENAGVAA